ncbi:MAG: small, acid-soluble spore protein, alpha/beta type [Sulfobacillus sp.]
MAKWSKGPSVLPNSMRDRFKYEVASELGLLDEIEQKGWADMPTRQLGRIGGKIGGNMVKVMIRMAEESMAEQSLED